MHRSLSLAAALALSACSSGLDVDPPENGLQLRMEPAQVAPGQEVLLCSYLAPLKTDLIVRAIDFHQTRGGHHVALFTSNTLKASGTQPCKDPNTVEGSAEMADWRPVSAGINAVNTKLPPGVALRVPAGKQLMLQSHFLNVSAETIEAESVANLFAFEGTPTTMADYLSFNEITAMKIPLGESQVTRECSFDHDLNVLTLLGHTHQHGTLYKLELQSPAGEWTTLYDERSGEVLRDTPPVKTWPLDAPLAVKAGQKWRYTCAWNNTTDHELRWPEEMCAAFMTYYPSKGFLLCNDGQVGALE